MKEKDSHEKLMKIALDELAKIATDIQKGKTPTLSPKLATLQKELDKISSKEDLDDEEVEQWVEKVTSKIEKK